MDKCINPEIREKIKRFAEQETSSLVGIFIPNRIDVVEPFTYRLQSILERFYKEFNQEK